VKKRAGNLLGEYTATMAYVFIKIKWTKCNIGTKAVYKSGVFVSLLSTILCQILYQLLYQIMYQFLISLESKTLCVITMIVVIVWSITVCTILEWMFSRKCGFRV